MFSSYNISDIFTVLQRGLMYGLNIYRDQVMLSIAYKHPFDTIEYLLQKYFTHEAFSGCLSLHLCYGVSII